MLNPDAPFVLRNNPKRFRIVLVAGLAFTALQLVSIVLGTVDLVQVVGLLCGLGLVAVSIWSLRNDAPVMTADHQGLSLRVFRGEEGIRRLDWEDVDAIYVHRISRNFRMLCVLPKHLDRERRWVGHERQRHLDKAIGRTGAPYSANLTAAGISDEQAFERLRTLAAGRATIGERPV